MPTTSCPTPTCARSTTRSGRTSGRYPTTSTRRPGSGCGPEPQPEPQQWRGRIQHISSGHERQFERMQDLIDFIGEQLVNEQSMLIVCDEQLSAE